MAKSAHYIGSILHTIYRVAQICATVSFHGEIQSSDRLHPRVTDVDTGSDTAPSSQYYTNISHPQQKHFLPRNKQTVHNRTEECLQKTSTILLLLEGDLLFLRKTVTQEKQAQMSSTEPSLKRRDTGSARALLPITERCILSYFNYIAKS